MKLTQTRQLIFNENFAPIGYELFGQEDQSSIPEFSSEDSAICRALTHVWFGFGEKQFPHDRPIYVKLTNMLLQEGIGELFPPDRFVFEIPPNLFLDEKLADYVALLYRKGYRLTLNSFTPTVERSGNLKHLNLFEVVKVDVSKYNRLRVKEFVKKLRKYRLKIAAEHVDTPELLAFAQEERFDMYQGSVFGEPERLQCSTTLRTIPYGKLFNHLLTGRVNRALCERIIMEDPALTHMFLRKAFNCLHNRKVPAMEVERGLARLDDDKLRHWSAVLLLDQAHPEGTIEEVPQVFRRGLVVERLAAETAVEVPPGKAFMFGIASALDRIFGEDIKTTASQLALGTPMKKALLGEEENDYALLLQAARAYEKNPEQPQLPPAFSNIGPKYLAKMLWDCQVNTEYIIRALEYTVPSVYQGNLLKSVWNT